MRSILFLFSEPLLDAGGVGRVAESLAEAFLRQGMRCAFVSLKFSETREHPKIVQYHLYSSGSGKNNTREALRRLILKEQIDLVINQSGLNLPMLALAQSVSDLVPIISVHHNCLLGLLENHRSILRHALNARSIPGWLQWPVLFNLMRWRSAKRFTKAISRSTSGHNHLVMLSESFVREARALAPEADKGKIHAIPNPAPFCPEPGALKQKKRRVLYVGRLENGQKRIDRLLDTWAEVEKCLHDWSLDIIGDGPDADSLKAYSRALGLEKVRFIGAADPRPYYRQSKLLLLTSDFEGFGMVLIEAQAHACVPITTKSFSSISEIVAPGLTGIVSASPEPDVLAAAVVSLACDSKKWRRLAINGLRHVDGFNSEYIARQWLDLIETVIEKTG